MAASSTLLARLKAGHCFNTVEVLLLRFWEARNDRFAINSESMEGSLVLALMLDEASSPVSR
ncbi:BnaC04g53220D [Brassica napus]|uniref:BnaC04g53220D protein n=1 Tax=Brassica napus TaxID=3708 RepID=A0A078J2M4_BRANA|nr:BnaC04g53220D [Brassica napus]